MNPTAALVHVAAIAAGVFGGLTIARGVAPDLPSDSTQPGVEQPSSGGGAGGKVTGSSPESYYHPGPLSDALAQTEEQFPAGEDVISLSIEPDRLSATTQSGDNTVAVDDLPVNAPERIIDGVNKARKKAGADKPVTLDDVRTFSFAAANPRNQSWYVLLDINTAGPPTEFWASFNGGKVYPR